MRKIIICLMLPMVFVSCRNKGGDKEVTAKVEHKIYTEAYRPQFHFSPSEMWMNDPNGLVYNDGVYHLFYQYYPEDIVWGPMHWGHAVSKDMVRWEHKPIALFPDEHGLIFSGSAVVDKKNTSGFAQNGEIPLVAVFTYHLMEGEREGRTDFQTQGIAFSLDNGESWVKYEGNPVIGNSGIKDFRDPKVFWHEASKSWIMVLVAGDHAKLYRSNDLKDWVHLSDFGKNQGAHGGVWECPDLFPLQVEGTEEQKWVLIISINPGAPNGGSGTQYFIGDFDGTRFISDQEEAKWLDYGTDNYAGVTYNNVPNGDRIFIGWMSNWDYARDTPTEVWRSAMTLPRKLSLRKVGEDYRLLNYPLPQVEQLASEALIGSIKIGPGSSENIKMEGLNQSRIKFMTASKDFTLSMANDLGETVDLVMDGQSGSLLLDRMNSGKVDFQAEFGNKKHHAPIEFLGERAYELVIYMDWSSIEVFVDGGLCAMTDQLFPSEPYNRLLITNRDGENAMEVSVSGMESNW